ncbi:hypothetical protein [Ruegeria sp. HKCCD6428]|uniref:hypothetical protein n=1 Tax=Ruegeria sp. HKCCD6428 TaxID=2683002 RepID=UPI0014923E5C|nr:hypothetical protein [Ruegeria sp. HKCCD6428]NOC84536.1 hypothetical protein [Ruegeria sp. HKCCD6428]
MAHYTSRTAGRQFDTSDFKLAQAKSIDSYGFLHIRTEDMNYPNQHQPRRPLFDENGEKLAFRTHISSPESQYDVYCEKNIICQTKLYRWVRKEFVNGTPISELHAYLFWDQAIVTKRNLGSTILQAVAYDPRKLKGKTKANPKACMIYLFKNPKELEYGLEWMICIWLRRVVLADKRNEVEEALNELVETDDQDLASLFWEPMTQPVVRESIREFDWPAVWSKYELKDQGIRPDERERPILRSFA